jgi:hypothetical protein
MPRPLVYRQFYSLSSRYYTVVLKTCNEAMFFIYVKMSEKRRFELTVTWLCADYIAADTSVVIFLQHAMTPLSALSKDCIFQRLTLS